MKKVVLLVEIVIALVSVSCSINYEDEILVSEFQGEWSGTYIGSDDKGAWNMTITQEGHIFGMTTSEVFNETYEVYGILEKRGNLCVVTGTASSGAYFTGHMSGNIAEGIWTITDSDKKAEWKGNRK